MVHTLFADWYREAEFDLSSHNLEARWSAVEALVSQLTFSELPSLVRLGYGLPPSDDFAAAFRQPFKEADPSFQMRDNDFELSILAGASIVHLLESSRSALSTCTALLVTSGEVIHSDAPVGDLITMSKSFLSAEAMRVRTFDETDGATISIKGINELKKGLEETPAQPPQIPVVADAVRQLADILATPIRQLRDSIPQLAAHMDGKMRVTTEQLDILWWLFSGYSWDLDTPRSSVPNEILPLVLGKELADHVAFLPGPVAAEALLGTALDNADVNGSTPTSITNAMLSAGDAWRQQLVGSDLDATPEDLVPVHATARHSLLISEASALEKAVSESIGADPLPQVPAPKLAFQIYTERLALRAMAEATEE